MTIAADMGRDWRGAALVAAGVVGILTIGAWRVAAGGGGPAGSERSIGQAVSGFLQAQRDGDCSRLIDLVTEAGWSDGGRRSRAEFLEQCADAVDGYQPDVYGLEIELRADDETAASVGADEADRARVVGFETPTLTADGIEQRDHGTRPERGHLVREDGEWKVAPGVGALRIGRSVEQTVSGYVDAYNDGTCERLLDHLSEAVWSQGGEVGREEFVERCTTGADARGARPWQSALHVTSGEVQLDGDDRATAVVTVGVDAGSLFQIEPVTVVLIREGLEWKLHGHQPGLTDEVDVGPPIPTLELFDLQAQLLGDIVLPDDDCFVYQDQPVSDPSADDGADGADEDAPPGIRREFFGPCDTEPEVFAYRYGDDAAAMEAAERQATTILADEMSSTGAVTGQRTSVPGVPDAIGLRTLCDSEGCDHAVALGVRNGVLVRVELRFDDDLELAATILAAQLERL
ncbi:MAG: hypothetical protein ACRD2C_05205 [Acidimicrobiales bacterium]